MSIKICNCCNTLYESEKLFDSICPNILCEGVELEDIDELMVPIVKTLYEKGYIKSLLFISYL